MLNLNSILIVDDNPENIKVLGSLLERMGYEIQIATNGKSALNVISASKPNLILLDIMMPDMSGYEVCKRIKSDELTKDIPIIFISALHSTEDKLEAFRVGGVDYITKPFEAEEVKVRVATQLELSEKREELLSLNRDLQKKIEEEVKNRLNYEQILIQQSKMAEMGEMMGAIAHQWRQPLNTLSLVVQKIAFFHKKEQLTQEKIFEIEKKAKEQINFMSKTIDDFRDFFKPNKTKEKFDILQAIDEVIDILFAQFKVHNIKIIIFKSIDIEIFSYKNEFKQVVLNILNNAKDAILLKQKEDMNFAGEVNITIFSNDTYISIEIEDNGGGIRDEVINEIFNPYFTTKEGEGTGIGLYMSKTIIEKNMNGNLSVKNTKKGAIFKIELPIVDNF